MNADLYTALPPGQKEEYNALIKNYILMDRFKVQMEICANDLSFCRVLFERVY